MMQALQFVAALLVRGLAKAWLNVLIYIACSFLRTTPRTAKRASRR
jgi:hypothetical protein